MSTKTDRQPMFETLEDRRLMSGTMQVAHPAVAPATAEAAIEAAAASAAPTITGHGSLSAASISSGAASPQILGGLIVTPGVFGVAAPLLPIDRATGTTQFVVTRALGSDGPATVDYTTVPGTALAGTDFVPTTGTLSFANGEFSKTISVPLVNDPTAAASRAFDLALSNPTGASLGLLSSAQSTIANLKSQVSVANVQQTVSNLLPTAAVTLTRAGNTTLPAVVGYATAARTALAGVDFTPVSGLATFLPGQSTTTVLVPVLNNAAGAATSAFDFTLTSAGDATVLGQTVTTAVTLTNPKSVVSTATGGVTAVTSAGNALVTVVRTGNLDVSATINYATQAVAGGPSGAFQAVSGTLSFAAGEASKVVSIPLVSGVVGQASSAFKLLLSVPGVNTILSALANSTQVTVVDAPAIIQTAAPTITTVDGATSAVVTFIRTGNPDLVVSAVYSTVDGTAHAGVDYTPTTGTLTFAAGETSKSVAIPLSGSPALASVATLAMKLTDALGGGVLGGNTTSNVETTNNRSLVQWSVATASADGQAGTVALTVTRTGNLTAAATIMYSTADITAEAGHEYFAAAGTVSFAAGEATKTVTIALTGDASADAVSTFGVTLTAPTGNAVLGAVTTEVVTVANGLSAVKFSPAQVQATEGQGTVTITVTRTGNLGVAGAVAYATQNGTAVAGTDFTATSGVLTFAPGQATASFTVALSADGKAEADETFRVLLSDATGNVQLDDADQIATVTLKSTGTPAKVSDVALAWAKKGKASVAKGITLTLDQPLTGTPNVADFVLYARSKDTAGGGGVAKRVALASVTYDAATQSLTVTPKKPLKANAFYQLTAATHNLLDAAGVPVDGASNGTAGSNLSLYFGTGNKLTYKDRDGDTVSLKLTGTGMMKLTRGTDGEGLVLAVTGDNAGTVVTGLVKKAKSGTGRTTLTSVTGLDAAQNKLPASLFTVAA